MNTQPATGKKSIASIAVPLVLLVMALGGWYLVKTTRQDDRAGESSDDNRVAGNSLVQTMYAAFDGSDWPTVEKACRQLLSEDELHSEARFNLAYSLYRQEKFDEAMEEFRKCLDFNEYRNYALFNLACLHARKGEHEQAVELLQEALDNGFRSALGIANQRDLQSLSSHPQFSEWVAQEDKNRGHAIHIQRQ